MSSSKFTKGDIVIIEYSYKTKFVVRITSTRYIEDVGKYKIYGRYLNGQNIGTRDTFLAYSNITKLDEDEAMVELL